MALRTTTLRIGGMTCVNCQNRIEKKLRAAAGVKQVRVSYSAGTAVVTYDESLMPPDDISAMIRELGYEVLAGNDRQSKALRGIGAEVAAGTVPGGEAAATPAVRKPKRGLSAIRLCNKVSKPTSGQLGAVDKVPSQFTH